MKNGQRQAVPILPAVELSKRPPPFKLIIDGCQDMNRLVDAADLGHGLRQLGGFCISPRKGSIQDHGAKAANGSDPDFSQFPKNFLQIGRPGAGKWLRQVVRGYFAYHAVSLVLLQGSSELAAFVAGIGYYLPVSRKQRTQSAKQQTARTPIGYVSRFDTVSNQ